MRVRATWRDLIVWMSKKSRAPGSAGEQPGSEAPSRRSDGSIDDEYARVHDTVNRSGLRGTLAR
jgi:hypothetical protein